MKESDVKKGTRVQLPNTASGRRMTRKNAQPVTGAIVSDRIVRGRVVVALDGNFIGDDGEGFRKIAPRSLKMLDRRGADE